MPQLDLSGANLDQKKLMLKYATDAYWAEIDNFWKRSIFFWGFIGAAFVAYASLYDKYPLSFLISCFGIVCSVAWTLVNRGSKYWYEAWEQKIRAIEDHNNREIFGANLFTNVEDTKDKGLWSGSRFSVSQVTIALSDFTILIWLLLAARSIHLPGLPVTDLYTLGGVFIAAIYVILLFVQGRSR